MHSFNSSLSFQSHAFSWFCIFLQRLSPYSDSGSFFGIIGTLRYFSSLSLFLTISLMILHSKFYNLERSFAALSNTCIIVVA